MKSTKTHTLALRSRDYDAMLDRVVRLIDEARRSSARAVNTLMTGTYWLIGRHIVEFEQRGKIRAAYGAELLKQLAADLSKRYGRGFSERNLEQIPREQQQMLIDTHPIRRLGTPEDVARAAAFLASNESSWITGIVLDVAGGSVMR